MSAVGLLALRLVLATVIVAHGAHELFGFWSGPGIGPGGLQFAAARFASMGLEPAVFLAVLAGLIQLIAGGLVAIGILTRSASASLVGLLAIMMWKAHLPWGFFLNWVSDPGRGHGIELSFVLAGGFLCLVFTGAGDFSLDGLRARRADDRVSRRARLRGKV
jgi:putative oxidoreductase